ncbi:putative RING-H2 finger protein ATL21B [Eucalyptus grandis]|uniref:putative RING-H2 finger protein ATL21B n=1 Tax=Eucalyptus grandis TaxID=71139 RepID=UPI00192EAFC2|nr:putative RING-H2 finger protein ATL21B [Eucalyptus grandis]
MTSNIESSNQQCVPSSCGDVRNISFPFRLKSDPPACGVSRFELACKDNRTVLNFLNGKYYVQFIDYTKEQIRLVDGGLQRDNCSSLPHFHDFNMSSYILAPYSGLYNKSTNSILVIVNCSKPVSSPFYIATNPCIKGSYSTNMSSNWNLYALVNPKVSDVRDFCTISGWTWASHDFGDEQAHNSSFNYKQIHNIMADGFLLHYLISSWKKTFFCYFDIYGYFRLGRYFYSERLSVGSIGGQACTSMYYHGGKY